MKLTDREFSMFVVGVGCAADLGYRLAPLHNLNRVEVAVSCAVEQFFTVSCLVIGERIAEDRAESKKKFFQMTSVFVGTALGVLAAEGVGRVFDFSLSLVESMTLSTITTAGAIITMEIARNLG